MTPGATCEGVDAVGDPPRFCVRRAGNPGAYSGRARACVCRADCQTCPEVCASATRERGELVEARTVSSATELFASLRADLKPRELTRVTGTDFFSPLLADRCEARRLAGLLRVASVGC